MSASRPHVEPHVKTFSLTKEKARERLLRAVEELGFVAVAYQLECSVSQVSLIARGRRKPGLKIACAIEKIFNIPVETWVGDDPEKTR